MIAKANVSMMDAMRMVTLKVKITRRPEWKIRVWIGIIVLRTAARVMGCGFESELVDAVKTK